MRTSRPVRRVLLGAAATAASVALLPTGSASAADGLTVTYDAVGSSTIAKTSSTVAIGPTTLTTTLDPASGAFTGHLPIPETTNTFKIIGLLPVQARVSFIEAAPVTGALVRSGSTTTVQSTATYYIRLSDVTVGGLPTFVGDHCQTAAPVSIPANTPAGEAFNLTTGGHLTGTYTLGDFADCGLTTALVNLLVPGPGNTVDLTVSNGRLG